MRRWVIDSLGRAGLRLDEVPVPRPGPNDILVRVMAVSLNARDLMMLDNGMGLTLTFPFVPASDMAGVVEAVGESTSRFRVGDRVISNFLPDWIDGKPGGTARRHGPRTVVSHARRSLSGGALRIRELFGAVVHSRSGVPGRRACEYSARGRTYCVVLARGAGTSQGREHRICTRNGRCCAVCLADRCGARC